MNRQDGPFDFHRKDAKNAKRKNGRKSENLEEFCFCMMINLRDLRAFAVSM